MHCKNYHESSVGDPDPELDPQNPHVLGVLDPDLDLLVRGLDPDSAPDRSLFL